MKNGELHLQREGRKPSRSLSRATLFGDSTPESPWREVSAHLTKEGRLVMFEYERPRATSGGEKTLARRSAGVSPTVAMQSNTSLLNGSQLSSRGRPRAVLNVDLPQMMRADIEVLHESLVHRRFAFSITTSQKRYVLAALSPSERDQWVLLLKQYCSDNVRASPGNECRSVVTLNIEVQEARYLAPYDVYCEILVDSVKRAQTATRSKSTGAFWGELFTFPCVLANV